MLSGGTNLVDWCKTLVGPRLVALARHLNQSAERIPQNTIDKPPSAELRPDQKDSDSLPDYPLLDGLLRQMIEQRSSDAELIAAGADPALVQRIAKRHRKDGVLRSIGLTALLIACLMLALLIASLVSWSMIFTKRVVLGRAREDI